MTLDTEPDGDVYVAPAYLAGSTYTGDPALRPLLDLGWPIEHDDLGNAYVHSPDHRIRIGYMPEVDDDALWRIVAHDDRFASPLWAATFNDCCPTEFVTAFTTELAQAYTEGPHTWQTHRTGPLMTAFSPLFEHGWELTFQRLDSRDITAPDGLAGISYDPRKLNPERELTTNETKWYMWGNPKPYRWYATCSTNTPIRLVAATTTALANPEPVVRWDTSHLNHVRTLARITPITPPPRSVPTPLDLRRQLLRARPARQTRASVPRWSTSSRLSHDPSRAPVR
jgi:Domain of unknown function (DUF317)